MERLNSPLLGLILAGGNSSRMGQDKALLVQNGTPLLRHVYQCAAEVCPRVYVITSRTATYGPLLPPTCEFIPEVGQNQGPLKAFREAIEFLEQGSLDQQKIDQTINPQNTDPQTRAPQTINPQTIDPDHSWILLLSCDLPNLNGIVLQEWVQNFVLAPHPSSNIPLAYIPRNPQGWWEPLCGFYSRQCRSSLDRFLHRGGRSFQHWLNQERVVPLPLKDSQVLLNLNTLET